MALLLAKAAGVLLMPPAILLLGALAALLLARRHPRPARVIGILVLAAAYLLSTRPGAQALLTPLETRHPSLNRVPPEAEAIVVLGGGRIPASPDYGGAALGDSSLQRVRFAARLARGNRLPIFTTGGASLGGASAGRLMARALVEDYGIDPDRVRAETDSRNTAGHVPRLRPLLGDRTRIVLVTTAWHMPRAAATFAAGGLRPIPAPTDFHEGNGSPFLFLDLLPQADYLQMSSNAFHEYLGLAWYALRGYL